MSQIEMEDVASKELTTEQAVEFPRGILGFELMKRFILMRREQEEPFLWLQMLEGPSLAFLLAPPFPYIPDYRPDVSAKDLEFIGVRSISDLALLNIVNLRPEGGATVNLKGPILINVKTMVGGQFVLENAADYPVRYPLPVGGALDQN